jgi:hypothetical protein
MRQSSGYRSVYGGLEVVESNRVGEQFAISKGLNKTHCNCEGDATGRKELFELSVCSNMSSHLLGWSDMNVVCLHLFSFELY